MKRARPGSSSSSRACAVGSTLLGLAAYMGLQIRASLNTSTARLDGDNLPSPPLSRLHEDRPSLAFEQWLKFPGMDPETQDVVDAIYKQQNPSDCARAKYFIFPPENQGLGADLRYNAWILFGAFQQNRVIIFPPTFRTDDDKWAWADSDYCGTGNLNPNCYFEPFSKCQHYVTDAMALAAPEIDDVWLPSEEPILWLPSTAWFPARWQLIEQLPHSEGKDFKTWMYPREMRYMVRPNNMTRDWARDFLRTALRTYKAGANRVESVYPAGPPEKAICMHIRQGDKAIEMALHPVEEYLAEAERFRAQLQVSHIFVTTESQSVMDEIMSEGISSRFPHFTYYFTQYPRMTDATTTPMAFASAVGRSYLALVSLANLYLGVHPSCVAFVETTSSNWCEIINDIRLTDGYRAEAPLVDFETSPYIMPDV